MCIDAVDPPRTRRDRGADTFAQCPQYRLALPRPIIPPKGYPLDPKIIGEHIRKRRLDLGLLQIEVAKMIGVTESTVWNWEHGTEPEIRHMPKIIEFIGYVPFECPDDSIGKLKYFKQVHGLSYNRLGKLMGRDPEQMTEWISGQVKPCMKNILSVNDFLTKWLRL
ncbi:MAG: helix-turn-helix transcriptional regulator [Nitrospirota bacterium]